MITHHHSKIESERQLRFDELRAKNNIIALGESNAKHWLDLLAGSAKELTWAISASLTPCTGMPSDRKHVMTLEALYSYEKAFANRDTVINRIKAAMQKNATAYDLYGSK